MVIVLQCRCRLCAFCRFAISTLSVFGHVSSAMLLVDWDVAIVGLIAFDQTYHDKKLRTSGYEPNLDVPVLAFLQEENIYFAA